MYKEDLEYLFRRYRNNEITEEELYRLFELLSEETHDEQLKALLDEVWEQLPQPAGVPVHDRKPLRTAKVLWTSIAAAVLVAGGLSTYFLLHRTSAKAIAMHHETNAAGKAPRTFELPDHSVVWLNAGTTLQYREGFAGNERAVVLDGEAYFEVTPDAHKPFLVKSGTITTRVLGTHFNVQAYTADERVAVTVISGKVAVQDTVAAQVTPLGAREEGVYQPSTHTFQTHTLEDSTREIAWTQGLLVFHKTPVSRVARMLESRFDRKIEVAPALKECVFYGEFDKESLDKILDMLAATLDGKVEEKAGTYYISGKGCF